MICAWAVASFSLIIGGRVRIPGSLGSTVGVSDFFGSVFALTSCPSEITSPSVSDLSGSVPNWLSSKSVKPSPSESGLLIFVPMESSI